MTFLSLHEKIKSKDKQLKQITEFNELSEREIASKQYRQATELIQQPPLPEKERKLQKLDSMPKKDEGGAGKGESILRLFREERM